MLLAMTLCAAALLTSSPVRMASLLRARPRMQAWAEPEFGAVKILSVQPSTGDGLYEVVA